ncbi:MAG: 30S ribosomal protein S1, partial [Planctomycetaceae bacterium]
MPSESERGPLASSFTTGEAEIAAAMQGVSDLSAGGVEPVAEAAPATEAKPSKGGKQQQGPINPEEVTAGTRLTGKVVSVYGDSVILDLSGQASAAVPVKNFESGKVPAVGVTLALIVEQYDAAEGLIRCRVATGGGVSKPQGNWEAVQTGMVVDCMVTKTNKGGLEVNVSNLRGFMPAAQVDLGFCSNLEQFVGQKLRAVVLEVNPQKRNLIVSRRQFLESTLVETREQAWNNLAVGQKVQGKVKTVKDYGAFVDLGGVDGLLHVSEMSWNRLNHPRDILSEGQDIEVQVLQMDREKMKISLGLKQLRTSPWLTIMEKYPIESTVRGKVTKA